jgi:putative PEP-CTERM system TPR-repeat lipoprotein
MIIHHINAGHYAEALASADAFIEKFPAAALPHTLKAAALLAAKDETGALEQYQTALRINPGDPSANHAMAALAIKRGEADTARQLFRNVLRAHPNNLPTLLKFARLEGSQGNTRGMLDWLKNAAKTHPDALRPRVLSARYYLKHKDHFKVIELLTPPQLDYVFDHSRLLLLGTAYLGANGYEQAAQTFETLIKHFPQSAEGHYLLSAAYSARGDQEAAQREVEKTLELNPNNLLAKLTYIKMLLTSNDLQAAKQQLNALLAEHAQTPEVQFLLGVLAEAQGQMEQAEKRYAKAVRDYPSSRTVRAYARILAKQERNAEAKTVLGNWLEQHPQDRPIRLILADRLLRDEPSQAREQYETLLTQDSHNVLALNNLASTLVDSEPARSLEYARQAYELQPDAPAVMDTLAMAALANDDLDTASSMIASAIKRTPDNPSLIYHKALVLNASGRPGQALELLSELLTLKKDFPERDAAKELLGKLKKIKQNAG